MSIVHECHVCDAKSGKLDEWRALYVESLKATAGGPTFSYVMTSDDFALDSRAYELCDNCAAYLSRWLGLD